MNIYKTGTDNPEAIIFFNPMGSSKSFWESILPSEIYDKYEVILFDYPGFNSEFIELKSLSEIMELINDEIISQIDKPIHFCGYSYGGMVVQELLKINHPQLKSVIIIASQNKLTNYDKELIKILSDLINKDLLLFCRLLTVLSCEPTFINSNKLFYMQLYASLRFYVYPERAISQQLSQMYAIDKINFPILEIPALYIYGEHDRMLKINSISEISALLPSLKIIKLQDSSHMLDGKQMFDEIVKFLNKKSHE